MSAVSGFVTFVVLWWIVLFAVLPWRAQAPEAPAAGHATSAPADPRLAWKAMWTTIITIVIWLGIFAIVESDLISFRDMASAMPK